MLQKPVKRPCYNSISFYLANVGKFFQSWIPKDQGSKKDERKASSWQERLRHKSRNVWERPRKHNILSLRDVTTRQSAPSSVI